MEVWRGLGMSVLGPLVTVGTRTTAPDSIEHAIFKLGVRIRALQLLPEGLPPDQIDYYEIDRPPVAVCPTAFLDGALQCVAEEVALHAMAGRVLALYGRAHPNLDGTPTWQAANANHSNAIHHANAALRLLRLALARAGASNDAERAAGTSFPRLSVAWDAWMVVAEQHADDASVDAALALEAVRAMRQAVMSEGANVWMIVVLGHGHGHG